MCIRDSIRPFGYRMPSTREEYARMCLDIRRQLRLTEHQPGNIGSYLRGSHFLVEESNPDAATSNYFADASQYHGQPEQQQFQQSSFYQSTPNATTAQAFYGEEEGSSMETSSCTSSDHGEEQLHDDNGNLTVEPIPLNDPAYGEKIYMAYTRTKKAWRRFSNKPVRRVRRFFKR